MDSAVQRNLGLDLARVTEAAALCATRWLGKGDGSAGLKAAVDAMRRGFMAVQLDGVLISGGAERQWPLFLSQGEKLGAGAGPRMDVAVDPVEGVSLLALGRPNAISVAAVAPAGSMHVPAFETSMQKLVLPRAAASLAPELMLDMPVADLLGRVAKALGKDVEQLTVFVLHKPRHKQLIQDIRTAGARILLHDEGDVAGALMVATPHGGADLLLGVGGAPEAVVSASALRGLGGRLLARYAPQSQEERETVQQTGLDLKQVFTEQDMVRAEDTFFAASGISTGPLLQGVSYSRQGASTHSLVVRGRTDTLRFIHSRHNRAKLTRISGLEL